MRVQHRPAYVEAEDAERLARTPPRREALVLFYCILALTLVWFRGRPHVLPEQARIFGWFAVNFVVLFVIPALFITYVWREPLAKYGLCAGEQTIWWRYFLVYLVVMLPIVISISHTPSFRDFYPIYRPARESVGWFILAALGWMFYFFAWEWFFRGFMLFALAPRYGGGIAILIQTIPFVMMHYRKPEAEAWSSIIAGIALGLMAFRGKSFIGTFLLHWLVALFMDLMAVLASAPPA